MGVPSGPPEASTSRIRRWEGSSQLIGICTAVIVLALVCATLCLAACILAIPYIGTVLLLPLFVFDRCYSLAFLEQLGGPWALSPATEEQVFDQPDAGL